MEIIKLLNKKKNKSLKKYFHKNIKALNNKKVTLKIKAVAVS